MAVVERLFSSYDEALEACGSGYQAGDLVEVIARKTAALIPHLRTTLLEPDPLAVSLLALMAARRGGEPVRIVDLGGACGYHFHAAASLLPDVPVIWHVVETTAMAQRGQRDFSRGNLRFFDDFAQALAALPGGRADLIHASSVLQYLPEPEAMIERLVAAQAEIVALVRFPIFDGPRTVGLQAARLSDNGPGPMPAGLEDRVIAYPITFCNREAVSAQLLAGYDIFAQFVASSAHYQVGGATAVGGSFLLRRRSAPPA